MVGVERESTKAGGCEMQTINHIQFPVNMIKLTLHRVLLPRFGYQENPGALNPFLTDRHQNQKLVAQAIT